jgi:hypothetical protein
VNLIELTFEELKLFAEKMDGFKYDKRTGEDKLRDLMTSYLEKNPDCLKLEPDMGNILPPITGEVKESNGTGEVMTPIKSEVGKVTELPGKDPAVPPTKEGMEKIQSIHRGEITTKFGVLDFGTDGIVEVSTETADYLCEINGYDKC